MVKHDYIFGVIVSQIFPQIYTYNNAAVDNRETKKMGNRETENCRDKINKRW